MPMLQFRNSFVDALLDERILQAVGLQYSFLKHLLFSLHSLHLSPGSLQFTRK
jgi:hypothetical protein